MCYNKKKSKKKKQQAKRLFTCIKPNIDSKNYYLPQMKIKSKMSKIYQINDFQISFFYKNLKRALHENL